MILLKRAKRVCNSTLHLSKNSVKFVALWRRAGNSPGTIFHGKIFHVGNKVRTQEAVLESLKKEHILAQTSSVIMAKLRNSLNLQVDYK